MSPLTSTGGRTLRLALALGLVLILGSLACSDRESEPVTFRYHFNEVPVSLDPAKQLDVYSSGVIDRIFDTLTRLDRVSGHPEPGLAESYTVSDDGLTYELRLRPEARFHNGRRVLAEDVRYSWERLLDPTTKSPAAFLLEMIDGAAAFQAGKAESITGLEVPSPAVLRVRLAVPFGPFLAHLAFPSTAVVPREEVERLGDAFARQPLGSGPYRFVEWVEDFRIVLERFDDHGLHEPEVERLIYEVVSSESEALGMFRRGQFDLLSQVPIGQQSELRQTQSSHLRWFPGLSWGGFCFRTDQPPFDDPKVRRAFALAVDRDALARQLGELQFTPGLGILPQGVLGHSPETMARGYDPDRARDLLAEAGYPEAEGFPFLTYTTLLSERSEKIAKVLVTFLADLGIEAEYKMMGLDSMTKTISKGEARFFLRAWGAGYPDPELLTRPLFHSQGTNNDFAYGNPEVDRLLDLARIEIEPQKRNTLYSRVEALVLEDAPCVPLYQDNVVILLQDHWHDPPLGYSSAVIEIERIRRKR